MITTIPSAPRATDKGLISMTIPYKHAEKMTLQLTTRSVTVFSTKPGRVKEKDNTQMYFQYKKHCQQKGKPRTINTKSGNRFIKTLPSPNVFWLEAVKQKVQQLMHTLLRKY